MWLIFFTGKHNISYSIKRMSMNSTKMFQRLAFSTSFIFLLPSAFSQNKIDELVGAELQFAKTALDQNTKLAFLNFLDSSGVVFNQGKIMNGIELWNTRQAAPKNKLYWHPIYAGIAASGDLGFTTGPWIFKTTDSDSILASGFFATIWHVTKDGKWKFLADMGISCGPQLYNNNEVKKWTGTKIADENSNLSGAETIFIAQYEKKGVKAFKKYVDDGSWFNLGGSLPFKTKKEILPALKKIPPGLKFTPVSSGIASSNDLMYVYGYVEHDNKKENYMRVWRRGKDGNKRILLQVLNW